MLSFDVTSGKFRHHGRRLIVNRNNLAPILFPKTRRQFSILYPLFQACTGALFFCAFPRLFVQSVYLFSRSVSGDCFLIQRPRHDLTNLHQEVCVWNFSQTSHGVRKAHAGARTRVDDRPFVFFYFRNQRFSLRARLRFVHAVTNQHFNVAV